MPFGVKFNTKIKGESYYDSTWMRPRRLRIKTGDYQIICGTGIGISIAANKVPGIRAALCTDCFCAEATRLHNDANILCMGGRVVGPGLAVKITDTFLNTPFSNDERHIRRINLIENRDPSEN